jgi:hypothetical protein
MGHPRLWLGRFPQGLKSIIFLVFYGTTTVVP